MTNDKEDFEMVVTLSKPISAKNQEQAEQLARRFAHSKFENMVGFDDWEFEEITAVKRDK